MLNRAREAFLWLLRWAFAGGIIVLVIGIVLYWRGVYNVAATVEHTAPVYYLLHEAMVRSAVARSRDIELPDLSDPQRIGQGLALYRDHCVRCHGAPGVAPEAFALGMEPTPPSLVRTVREWSPQALYWVVREGIKMTGMPAWKYRLSDQELWDIVAFLPAMARMSPAEYKGTPSPKIARAQARSDPVPGADVERGRQAIGQYGCSTCHVIPGVIGADSPVGPPLKSIEKRTFIAGRLPNTPENLQRWIRSPHSVDPLSAMPDLGVTPRDAQDIAAYLLSQK